jgi:hypothetical protein
MNIDREGLNKANKFQTVVTNLMQELNSRVTFKAVEYSIKDMNGQLTDDQILAHARTFFTQQLAEAMSKQLKDTFERQNLNQ